MNTMNWKKKKIVDYIICHCKWEWPFSFSKSAAGSYFSGSKRVRYAA